MKKLSALIALLVCVTIGGVYATWTYSDTNDIADVQKEITVTMPDATLSGANGVYKIETDLAITIDQKDAKDHTAVLKFSENSKITVTFTVADFAPNTIKEHGLDTKLYFGTSKDATGGMVYKMDAAGNYSATGTATPIFNFKYNASNMLNIKCLHEAGEGDAKWTRSEVDGVITFTYVLSLDEIAEIITLSQNFVLDIHDEYRAFRDATTGTVICFVTDGVVTSVAGE